MNLLKLEILAVVLAWTLTSCATTFFPRQDIQFWEPFDHTATFHLKDVTILTKPTTGNLKQTASALSQMAARQAGLVLDSDEAGGQRLDLIICLEEREFGVDLETYNSISVVLKVWTTGADAKQIGQAVFAEESKNTLRATSCLARVLEATFQLLGQKMQEKK